MRRSVSIVLMVLGTVGGYASGIMQLRECHRARAAAFERHVADVCVEAARGGR